MSEIRLWINAQEVKAKPDQTIMQAADEAGITIPRLCYHPSLKPSGSCRLCAVEIDGYRGLPAACTSPVAEGMSIKTDTPKVRDFRKEMLLLILQDHPRECLGCPRNGTCELQQLVQSVGIDFPYQRPAKSRPPAMPGGSYFERDYSLCVRCGRCVRICHEVRGTKAIVFREKAGRQEVSTPFERPLEEVGCQFCGACVDVCPVGALREKTDEGKAQNRDQIFSICENMTNLVMDLYSKQMPNTWRSSICPICSSGCKMSFELGNGGEIIQARPHLLGPSNRGQSCVQGRFLLRKYLQGSHRLTKPLIKENGAYKETDWNTALDSVSKKLAAFAPGEVAVLTDARATNEELYALQKFARATLRTDGVGCLVPPGHMAVSEVIRKHFGAMGSLGSLDDIEHAGCVFTLGISPAANHPISGTYLRRAVLGGTKLVAANPVQNNVTRYADVFLNFYPGTEVALLSGLLRLILMDPNNVDEGIAAKYSSELQALKQSVEPYNLEQTEKLTGISREKLIEAACLMGGQSVLYILFGEAVAKSDQAEQIVQALISLSHAKGSIGKPGGGIAPVYGNGNLQGAWDMGMVSHLLPGQIEKQGSQPVDLLKELKDGKYKALMVACEDLQNGALDALKSLAGKLEYVVVQDIAKPADNGLAANVVLPVAAILEKEGTLTNSERRVQAVHPVLSAPGEAKPLLWVLSELANRMNGSGMSADSKSVFIEIQKQVPSYIGMDPEQQPSQWRSPDRQPEWIGWQSPPVTSPSDSLDKEFPFAVISRDRLRGYGSGPLLSKEAINGQKGSAAIEMNPADLFGMGFTPGMTVRITTRSGEFEGQIAPNPLLMPKVLSVSSELLQGPFGNAGGIIAAKVEER